MVYDVRCMAYNEFANKPTRSSLFLLSDSTIVSDNTID